MAATMSNGGIGKSPAIDKINMSSIQNFEKEITKQMEHLAVNQMLGMMQNKLPVCFKSCKSELDLQLHK